MSRHHHHRHNPFSPDHESKAENEQRDTTMAEETKEQETIKNTAREAAGNSQESPDGTRTEESTKAQTAPSAAESAAAPEGSQGSGRPAEKNASPEEQIAQLKAALKAAQAEMLDVRMRAQAETENFKKRLQREHEDHLKYAAEKVLKDLIPTLDNLELAITYGSDNEACQDMLKGITMTHLGAMVCFRWARKGNPLTRRGTRLSASTAEPILSLTPSRESCKAATSLKEDCCVPPKLW